MCLIVVGAAPAFADNGPHVKAIAGSTATDGCAACHRAHTAKAASLLKSDQQGICYTCHGSAAGGATTDVQDGIGYTTTGHTAQAGALRGGGFSFALINGASASSTTGTVSVLGTAAATTSSHTIDGTNGTAWGNGAVSATASYGATVQLRCGSCHDPHGNGNYRILRSIPVQSGAVTGVTIADATTKSYTTTNYWASTDTNAAGFITGIASWCSTCHTRYLANNATTSGDAVYMFRHKSNDTTAGGPNCITCHVAHGTNVSGSGASSSAVTNPDGTTPAAGTNSRLLRIDNRGTCRMCHTQ
jgi:predicted CXXCH cytochrome family protein